MIMNYRAEVSTQEQLKEALAISDFDYIYAPMELFAVDVGANSVRPKPNEGDFVDVKIKKVVDYDLFGECEFLCKITTAKSLT